ncbi:methyltransferase family protein [Algoriphagus boseongensis]|uniref:Methyltransferase family protein n=1 Tax=Algoriphagus boseongensis TaxID=1442587 RepID=A0A4R6TBZ2_9BACT|nr:class I SAM-dependent methyltransferase [Algoriphagus boseongensis]TDQ19582.1 methyltransferase family protein [Algoriphagus boseongensis]
MIPRIKYPYSWVGHIPFTFFLVDFFKPKLIVELGTHTGNSFLAFSEAAKHFSPSSKVYGIDLWQGDEHAGYYEENVFFELEKHVFENYKNQSFLVRKDFNVAVSDFEDGSIDLLHIDGLHSYEAVKNDFETWKSKLSDEAIVIFHDIRVFNYDFGVFKYWEEISTKYKFIYEFDHSNGLGICAISENTRNHEFFTILNIRSLRYIFESYGNSILRDIRIVNRLNHFENSYYIRIKKMIKKVWFFLKGSKN